MKNVVIDCQRGRSTVSEDETPESVGPLANLLDKC